MRMIVSIALGTLTLLIGGCATDIGPCRRPIGDRGLTPAVAAAIGEHAAERVTWVYTLVEAQNLERDTELEVEGMPLSACGRPLTGSAPVGRFVVIWPSYLEAADLGPGSLVTATGEITGTREGRIGDAFYHFPLLRDPAPLSWPDQETRNGWSTRPVISIGVGAGSGPGRAAASGSALDQHPFRRPDWGGAWPMQRPKLTSAHQRRSRRSSPSCTLHPARPGP